MKFRLVHSFSHQKLTGALQIAPQSVDEHGFSGAQHQLADDDVARMHAHRYRARPSPLVSTWYSVTCSGVGKQQAPEFAHRRRFDGSRPQIVGETLAGMVDIDAAETLIDVTAGNGNASLAAAHRMARITSTDYVPALLEQGRARRRQTQRLMGE